MQCPHNCDENYILTILKMAARALMLTKVVFHYFTTTTPLISAPPTRISGRLPCILASKINKIYSLVTNTNRLTSSLAKTAADFA